MILFLFQKQCQIQNTGNTVARVDYKALEKNAITTFLVTMSHILLVTTLLLSNILTSLSPAGCMSPPCWWSVCMAGFCPLQRFSSVISSSTQNS